MHEYFSKRKDNTSRSLVDGRRVINMYAVKECGVCHNLPSFRRMPHSAKFHKDARVLSNRSVEVWSPLPWRRGEKR